ncbi:MAG TPA: DUF3102 domain-containing protein [Coleofasciculaceae cyanobacterium]
MGKLEKKSQVVTSFDYEVLEAEQRIVIQQRTGEIKERLRHSAQDIWEIGQKLADVRSRLKHGQFDAWLKAEFGWSRRTAYNFISVYEAFGERANLAQIDIATSALYLLAAPSTPQEVRNEFLQRAKEGETVTHKELRQVIKEEKSQSSPAVDNPEPSQIFIPKPEVVTLIPKAVVEAEKPIVQVSTPKCPLASPVATPCDIQPGWYLLEKQHLLFCGDTASAKFVKRTPYAALAIAITSDDWDHDWLIERAKTAIVFPEPELKEQMIEQLIQMFSQPGEVIIFPWLPDSDMIAVAHKLERFVWAGDPDQERCRNAIAQSGLKFERIS